MSATFRFLTAPGTAREALSCLSGGVAGWFRERYGQPTEVQRLAWPAVRAGEHVLISAPTGTGKTLAALLPLFDELFVPAEEEGSAIRLLYLAPLKALVNDAARNLEDQFEDLSHYLPADLRPPQVQIRTGDTTPPERRRLRDAPPEVLLTTPESLALLLSQPTIAELFAGLRHVVVDEVHALAGNKRGADLAVCLERLPRGVRRLGLSATATPLEVVARWLVGVERPCTIACAGDSSSPEISVEPLPEDERFLTALVERLAIELPRHRAVLIFTNTRALTERLAWALRRRLPQWDALIAVHHSALAARRREQVESRFKRGLLRVVVTSTSLELGIDIGSVDLAILVHPPGDVVRLLQRIGRAGHEPGGLRRGLLLTANASELLEAVVTCASGRAGQCEPLTLARAPLDVLAQQIVGMACARSIEAEEVFELVRRAAPFAELARAEFDAVFAYLRGLDSRGNAWLPARLREDGDCWRITNARTARLMRRNLGTILSERIVTVRLRDGETIKEIGEIEEVFAERLLPGDRFLLDGRCLEFRSREEGSALVEEVPGRPRVPRWNSGGWPLSSQLAERLFLLRQQAAEALREGPQALRHLLQREYELGDPAIELLSTYFQEQECISEIPDATTLLVEQVATESYVSYYLHTPLNRPANEALARVAVRRLEIFAKVEVADLGFALTMRTPLANVAERFRQLLAVERFREELNGALRESESLRTRFVQVATTGLMLLRHADGKPRKVGGTRWAERRLFEQVRQHDEEFVLLRQALREIGEQLCDAAAAEAYCATLPRLTIRVRPLTRISPLARSWTQQQVSEVDHARTAAEALARLHEQLTGIKQ